MEHGSDLIDWHNAGSDKLIGTESFVVCDFAVSRRSKFSGLHHRCRIVLTEVTGRIVGMNIVSQYKLCGNRVITFHFIRELQPRLHITVCTFIRIGSRSALEILFSCIDISYQPFSASGSRILFTVQCISVHGHGTAEYLIITDIILVVVEVDDIALEILILKFSDADSEFGFLPCKEGE